MGKMENCINLTKITILTFVKPKASGNMHGLYARKHVQLMYDHNRESIQQGIKISKKSNLNVDKTYTYAILF